MARTRAERRYNTHKKTSARKAMAIRGEIDQWPSHGYCGGKISLNGEAASCSKCMRDAHYDIKYHQKYMDLQLDSFMKAIV